MACRRGTPPSHVFVHRFRRPRWKHVEGGVFMFRCPHCGQTYDTTLFSAGEMFCCLHCGKPFVIDSVRPAKHAQRQTRPQRPQTSSHTRPNPTAAPSSRPEILAYQSMTTIGQSLVSFFTTWGIKGRCSRSEFWWGILWALFFCLIFLYLISRLLVFLFHQESLGDYIIARLALCLLFIKLTSLLCRRLHDIGWRSTHLMVGTGIVCALLCVPGPPSALPRLLLWLDFVALALCCGEFVPAMFMPSQAHPNCYGPIPNVPDAVQRHLATYTFDTFSTIPNLIGTLCLLGWFVLIWIASGTPVNAIVPTFLLGTVIWILYFTNVPRYQAERQRWR